MHLLEYHYMFLYLDSYTKSSKSVLYVYFFNTCWMFRVSLDSYRFFNISICIFFSSVSAIVMWKWWHFSQGTGWWRTSIFFKQYRKSPATPNPLLCRGCPTLRSRGQLEDDGCPLPVCTVRRGRPFTHHRREWAESGSPVHLPVASHRMPRSTGM